MKRLGRRNFIKYLSISFGLILLGRFPRFPQFLKTNNTQPKEQTVIKPKSRMADGLDTEVNEHDHFTFVIDVGACIGCRRCAYACKQENNVPDTISPLWTEIVEVKSEVSVTGHPSPQDLKEGITTSYTEAPRKGHWYLPMQCNHCDNPPCVKVCPTGATYKAKDGLVLMDYDKCIGCRLCVVACPYSARRFNWWQGEIAEEDTNPLVPVRSLGVVEKCTFCVHRVRHGRPPACVEACPVRARHFGDINDTDGEIYKLLNANLNFRLLEELNTSPNIRYITRGKKWY